MLDYLERGVDYLGSRDGDRVGNLVNSTIGKHLPSLFKRFNYRHVSSLAEHEYGQMHFHINDLLHSDRQCFSRLRSESTYRCCSSTANGTNTPPPKAPVVRQPRATRHLHDA
jgi:hypothetical protein